MSISINSENLSIGFGNNKIVTNLNFNINKEKFIFLMGRNGVGKSCLLKTLAGLIPYLHGSIKIGEEELSNIKIESLARVISVLLTDKIQIDYLKVGELISLSRSPYTNWNDEFQHEDCLKVEEAVQLLGVSDLLNKYFAELSDGQKQKVLLCRSIAQSPQILILDEPTTYLDIPSKIDFLKSVKKIVNEKKIIVIMSTHDHLLMNNIADEIWLLNEKHLVIDSPEGVISSGLFEKEFGLNLN